MPYCQILNNNSYIGQAICSYIMLVLCKNMDNFIVLDIKNNKQCKTNNNNFMLKKRKRRLLCSPPIGVTNFVYDNHNLSIETSISNEMSTLVRDGNNIKPILSYKITIDDDKNTLVNLFDEAIDYYDKNIINDREDNKLNYYIYEEYWEFFGKNNKRYKNTIILDNIHEIFEEIENFMNSEQEYEDLGIPHQYNMLLSGLPGTGKSSLIHCIASEYDYDIAYLSCDIKHTNNTLLNAVKKFDYFDRDAILVIEDVDVFFDNKNCNISVGTLLNVLDGLVSNKIKMILMTTNREKILDNILLRSERIHKKIIFTYSTPTQIRNMFLRFMKYQKENVDEFVKKVGDKKITSAILQKFLFKYRNNKENICNKIKELSQIAIDEKCIHNDLNFYT